MKVLATAFKVIRSTTIPRSTQTGSGLHLANQTDNNGAVASFCTYCKEPLRPDKEQVFSIHRDGFSDGPEVPLCHKCVANEEITLSMIWDRIGNPEPLIEAMREVQNGTV